MCYKYRMKKIETRTLKPEVQEQIRYQAVRLRKAGKKYKEIGELLGVSYSSVCEWYKSYEREGINLDFARVKKINVEQSTF